MGQGSTGPTRFLLAMAVSVLWFGVRTLWTGIPGNYTDPNASKEIYEVRKLVDDGKYGEATTAAVKLLRKPADFDFKSLSEETYGRDLDLDTAIVNVKNSVDGVEFKREHFASYPDQVIVSNISGSKSGSLSFTISLSSKLPYHSYVNGQNQIIMEGSCPGKNISPKVKKTEYPKGNDNPRQEDNLKGIQFSAVSDGAGAVHVLEGNKLKVEGSDWAVILLVASSSFDGPFTRPSDSKRDPTSESLDTINSIRNLSYSEIYARHLADYQKLFSRVSLQLSNSSHNVTKDGSSPTDMHIEGSLGETVSTAERVNSFQTDEDHSLVELLFQYRRYLLISCSRPGSQPANLQGIWNQDIEPAFEYVVHYTISQVNYEARGWVAHQVYDIWAKTSLDRGQPVWALWQMGGSWLCTHLWEHYSFTMYKDFLENKAYLLLEGCATFLLDWLIEGHGEYLETNPSTSPEHNFTAPDGKPASVSHSSTMDMSIIREVFAAEVLGKSEDNLVKRVRNAQPRLYPTKIAVDGCIMEWAQDFEDPQVNHRHLSHLFGLFPGHTITIEENPDLSKAAENSLYKRGVDGPGWSTTLKAALWARLANSENAYQMVKHLINLVDPDNKTGFRRGLYSNLFNAHPPFQIDANFGFSAAIAEMLVQSTMNDLYLLPALPRDKWAKGCAKGLKARGVLTISICWNEGDLHEVGLWSRRQNSTTTLHYRVTLATAKVLRGVIYTFDKHLKRIKTFSL
ncbi:hypothetical protein RJ639_033466 [Escallonia herrerae]|uniref:Glycosyl hydrolase family 95 N-terminal domain-containing protein n=1 Tax=Escallonia herrerae TaxID=1293975 RepID=A0AA88WZC5_9ASTE|nr:hypothetical protein RJ639_033466 [Escallonia herrerae]